MLQRIVDLGPEVISRYDLSSLKAIVVSGSALPGDLAGRAMDLFGDVGLQPLRLDGGGDRHRRRSEGSPRCPWHCRAPDALDQSPILDDAGNPVPQGSVGRVFVGSQLSFEGYTGGADKSASTGCSRLAMSATSTRPAACSSTAAMTT